MARFRITARVPPGAERDPSANTILPEYGSISTRLRPPGVRSSGKCERMDIVPPGFAGRASMNGVAPGIAARAIAIARSGEIMPAAVGVTVCGLGRDG